MFNNINDNSEYLYNSQLEKQTSVLNLAALRANANRDMYSKANNMYVDKSEISANAIELFQKDCDIAKFNKIAMSNLTDESYLGRMAELFREGVVDPFEEDAVENLVTNSKLWDDLGL